jgi:hypothetical protein
VSTVPINDSGKLEHLVSAHGAVDPHVIARTEELREQGFRFHDIAAVLTKHGLMLSAERVKEIFEVHLARQQKKNFFDLRDGVKTCATTLVATCRRLMNSMH